MSTHSTNHRCSWPALLLLPLVIVCLIPTFVKRGNIDEILFTRVLVGLFVLRWAVAIIRREQNRDWLFYVLLLILVPGAIYAVSERFWK